MANVTKDNLIKWIKDWFAENGPDSPAVIGMSGGKDSTIAAALLVEALGADRVIGVMMPNGTQLDIEETEDICEWLGIQTYEINIGSAMDSIIEAIPHKLFGKNSSFYTNTPPRLRMTTLYAVAALQNGRVINTSNKSERMIGWSTRWGDSVGDMSLFGNLLCSEVIAIGDECDLRPEWVHKTPSDGLTGKSDEDNFGFTYDQLDAYLIEGDCGNAEINALIQRKIDASAFKRKEIDTFSKYLY